jgi:hypothetical protein
MAILLSDGLDADRVIVAKENEELIGRIQLVLDQKRQRRATGRLDIMAY